MRYTDIIKLEDVKSSFHGTSFSSEERAERFLKGFHHNLSALYEECKELSPVERLEEFEQMFERTVAKYKTLAENYLRSESRCYSTMITGAGNFPVRQQEKRRSVSDKRMIEYSDFYDNTLKYYDKKFREKRVIGMEEIEEDFKKINETNSSYSRTLYKSTLEKKIYVRVKSGFYKEVKELLDKDNYKTFTKRHVIHATIERLKERVEQPSKEFMLGDIKVIANNQEQRLQIFFNDKPSKEVREFLKSENWRWTPSNNCWQNYLRQDKFNKIKEYFNK